MTDADYGYTKNLGKIELHEAINRVEAALKTEGFGVLTDIDVKKTLKKKIGVEFRNYRILGACNPGLAHHALSDELLIGLLLPCNVIVFEEDDGTITVSAANPSKMFQIVNKPGMADLAANVDAKIQRVIEVL